MGKNKKGKKQHLENLIKKEEEKKTVIEGQINYKLVITEYLKSGIVSKVNLHVEEKENLFKDPAIYSYIFGKIKNIFDETEAELRKKSDIITYSQQEQRENLAKMLVAQSVLGDFLGQAMEKTIKKKLEADNEKSK